MNGMVCHVMIAVSWQMDCELADRVAAIRAAGDPASIADLKPAAIPDAVNAAVQLDRLAPRLDVYEMEVRAFYRTPLGPELRQVNLGPQGDMNPTTPRQVEVLRTVLAPVDDLEQMILLASWCGQYASTQDFSLPADRFVEEQVEGSRVRAIARFLDVRTRLLVADGLRDEAIERWLALMQLARLQPGEEPYSGYLLAIALRSWALNGINEALKSGSVGLALRGRIEAELELAYDPLGAESAMRASRALSISVVRESAQQMPTPLRPVLAWTVTLPLLVTLDDFDIMLPEVSRPWPEMSERLLHAPTGARPPAYGVGAAQLVKIDRRDLAKIRALRVVNALGSFAATRGRQPTGVEELALPPDALADPFSTAPLVVRRHEDKWLVYSVGEDGVDNGGIVGGFVDPGWATIVHPQ
jgi:hypothetical protein